MTNRPMELLDSKAALIHIFCVYPYDVNKLNLHSLNCTALIQSQVTDPSPTYDCHGAWQATSTSDFLKVGMGKESCGQCELLYCVIPDFEKVENRGSHKRACTQMRRREVSAKPQTLLRSQQLPSKVVLDGLIEEFEW